MSPSKHVKSFKSIKGDDAKKSSSLANPRLKNHSSDRSRWERKKDKENRSFGDKSSENHLKSIDKRLSSKNVSEIGFHRGGRSEKTNYEPTHQRLNRRRDNVRSSHSIRHKINYRQNDRRLVSAMSPRTRSIFRSTVIPEHHRGLNKPNLRKTELCLYHMNGYCPIGEFCFFAHGQKDLVPRQAPNANYRTVPCRNGENCKFKNRCYFIH